MLRSRANGFKRKSGLTPNKTKQLLDAAEKGDLESLTRLCKSVKNIEVDQVKNSRGFTLLHCACWNGHLRIVKFLIEDKDADVECQDKDGWTPLHGACFKGRYPVALYLVKKQYADVDKQDDDGRTPLHVACEQGYSRVIGLLVGQGKGDIYCQDENGSTPLHVACSSGRLDVVKSLVGQQTANIECRDHDNRTPLDKALETGHSDLVNYLLGENNGNENTGRKPRTLAPPQSNVSRGSVQPNVACKPREQEGSENKAKRLPPDLGEQTKKIKKKDPPQPITQPTKPPTKQPAKQPAKQPPKQPPKQPVKYELETDQPLPRVIVGDRTHDLADDAKLPARNPSDILKYWYNKALQKGKKRPWHIRLMMSGQFGGGKTSILRSLKGEPFREEYESTEGIEVGHIDKQRLGPKLTFQRAFSDWYESQERGENEAQHKAKDDDLLQDTNERDLESLLSSRTNNKRRSNKKKPPPTKREKNEATSDDEADETNIEGSQAKDTISMSVWDFAGQIEYHSMHQMFFRSKCIYLLVLDLQTDEKKRQSKVENMLLDAQKWMNAIVSSAGTGIGLIVVGTHADLFDTWKEAEDRLRYLVERLSKLVSPVEWDHVLIDAPKLVVDNRFRKGIPELWRALQKKAMDMLDKMEFVPFRWLRLHEKLESMYLEANHFCVPFSRAEKFARKVGFDEEDELTSALSYFDQLGDIVYVANKELCSWVFPKPQLLLNAMRPLVAPPEESVWFTSEEQQDRRQLKEKGYLSNDALARLWKKCGFENQVELRKVLSASGLIMDFIHGVVVPCRAPNDPIILEERAGEFQIEVETEFLPHLPPSMFPFILAMVHGKHGLNGQQLSMISQTCCCLALKTMGDRAENDTSSYQFRAKFSIQQFQHSILVQILAAPNSAEHKSDPTADRGDESTLKTSLTQLCMSLLHTLHSSVKERYPELSLKSWIQTVVKCNDEIHKWCILETQVKNDALLSFKDSHVCRFGVKHTLSDAIGDAKSVNSAFRDADTTVRPTNFQPTMWLKDDGTDEHVGAFLQDDPQQSAKYSMSIEPNFFLSHTGRDGIKESIGCPTHWFLTKILGVKAFIDEVDLMGGAHKDEALTQSAYECTHALVILSPSYRQRIYCVKELNTFMFRKARNDGIQVIPALWGIRNVDGYSPEVNDLCWIKHRSGSSEVDFMVQTLWPKLIQILGREPFVRGDLEKHLCSYVLEMRSVLIIPPFLETFVGRVMSGAARQEDSQTDTAHSAEGGNTTDAATTSPAEQVDESDEPILEADESSADSSSDDFTSASRMKPSFPRYPVTEVHQYDDFSHASFESSITSKTSQNSLVFHCTRGPNRMDVPLPVSDRVTLQDLYDILGQKGTRGRMRKFPEDHEDIKAKKKKVQLEFRTSRSGEALMTLDLSFLPLLSTQQMWEHSKFEIWADLIVADAEDSDWEDDADDII